MHRCRNPAGWAVVFPSAVKPLVGTGYAFLIGFRIVKGGYINIDRNKAVIQDCRLYVHFTQHVDICLLDVFAQG